MTNSHPPKERAANPERVAAKAKVDDTRTRILEAAHLLVGRCGFDGASIRDIARESRTNPALVYYYFGSKDGLFSALADHNADRVGAILREAAALDGPVRDRVRHFLLLWLKAVSDHGRPIAPWFRKAIQSPGEQGEAIRTRVARNIGVLAGILEEGVARRELRDPGLPAMTIASGLMMSVAGLSMELLLPHRLTGVDFSTEEARSRFVEGMLELWFEGLEMR